MSLLSNIKRLFAKSERGAEGTWLPVGGTDVAEQNLLINNKEWVFIAVDRIGTAMSSVRFKVMRYKKNGDDTEVFEGPMVDFLDKPGKQFTGKDFIYLNTVNKELTGNAFWERLDRRNLAPLISTQVKPIIEKGKLLGYEYNDGGKLRTITPDNLLHDRYVDPLRPYWGVGKLQKIARWVDTSSFSNEFLRKFFINGAQFGGFIETDEESEERINLIKAGLVNDHVGIDNAHKIAVLPRNSKFAPATATMSDMEMGATDDRYRDKILAGFGVPKTLVGLTTEVNRASAEAAEYVFARYTLKPIADDLISFLNVNVAPLLDNSGQYYFAYDEFIPDNKEVLIREREVALNKQPYKTVNEVRAEVGLPPVKGGDTIYGNPFQVPLGTPAPAPEPAPGDDDEDLEEPKKHVPARARRFDASERLVDALATRLKDVVVPSREEKDASSHKTFVARVEAHEKLIAQKVRDFNQKQKNAVVQKLNLITKGVNKSDFFEMDQEVGVLVDMVTPMLKTLMLEQAVEEYLAQGFPGTLTIGAQTITKAVELAAKRLAKSYNNTTADLLKSALNDGIQAGDDIYQLTERVNAVYEYSDMTRAAAVARTESVYIANEGSREAYRQSGVVKSVRWYTAEDELVCEFCGPMNGNIIGINEKFFNKGETVTGRDGGSLSTDYRAIDVPPLHTNCRCFIRPEVIEV